MDAKTLYYGDGLYKRAFLPVELDPAPPDPRQQQQN